MRVVTVAVGLAALGALVGAACSRDRAAPNLVLITLDTVRADRLGCYGAAGAETGTLDRVARDGAAVETSIAVAPLTLPSHASILTALHPPRHGVRDNADFRLPDADTTLAEHLKAQGYATAAAVGSLVLSRSLGLAQGFDTYTEPAAPATHAPDATAVRFAPIVERSAREVTDDAIAALERLVPGPFFLWAHYYDPHYDYAPPEPFASRFAGRPYEGEIAYTDAEIGRLIEALRSRGLLDATLVVVTADHGESLGEHGEETHGLFVYDATIRVPLIVRFPEIVPAGSRYPGIVSGVDIAPTVLELMGLSPMTGVNGVSHAEGLRTGRPPAGEPVYAESVYPERAYGWAPLAALRGPREKYIDAPEPEIYDLESDPGERTNLAPDRADGVRDGKRALAAALERFGRPAPGTEAELTAEQRQALESLGYVAGAAARSGRRTARDPKDLVLAHNTLLRAKNLVLTGHWTEVDRLVGEVLEADPGNPAALALRGTVRFATGDAPDGLDALLAAARASPGVYEIQWNLANALHVTGRHREAVGAYRAAIALQPSSGPARHGLGNALYALGDLEGAVAAYGEAVRLGAGGPALRAALGAALADAGDVAAAERELEAALASDPSLAEAWNKLGVLVDRSGRRDEALALFGRALEARPEFPDALFNRGKLLLLAGRAAEAERDAVLLIDRHPGYAAGWFLRANVLASKGDRTGALSSLDRCLAVPGIDPKLAASARRLSATLRGQPTP